MNEHKRDDSIDFRVKPPPSSNSNSTRISWWIIVAIAIVSTVLVVFVLKQAATLTHGITKLKSDLSRAQDDLHKAQIAKEITDQENKVLSGELADANAVIATLNKKLNLKGAVTGQAQVQNGQQRTKTSANGSTGRSAKK